MEQINPPNRPRVGVGVMILKDGKVLLGRRKGAHGADQYAFPGGHLEFGESFTECAIRETEEETGIQIKNVQFQYTANIQKFVAEGLHYAHISLIAEWVSGDPVVKEPEKCGGWDWYPLDTLPEPMFVSCTLAIESYKTGKNYYDADEVP